MELRLRVKGNTLAEKLRRGARYLPRKVRRSAVYLSEASAMAEMPSMQPRLDHEKISEAYDVCVMYLKPLGSGARRRAMMLDMLTGIAVTAVVTFVLVIGLLVWRGYL